VVASPQHVSFPSQYWEVTHLGKVCGCRKASLPRLTAQTARCQLSNHWQTSYQLRAVHPVFNSPSTPNQTRTKREVTPKATLKAESSAKPKSKRRRSNLDDSDEDEIFNENFASRAPAQHPHVCLPSQRIKPIQTRRGKEWHASKGPNTTCQVPDIGMRRLGVSKA
jgi:hypothetical protein